MVTFVLLVLILVCEAESTSHVSTARGSMRTRSLREHQASESASTYRALMKTVSARRLQQQQQPPSRPAAPPPAHTLTDTPYWPAVCDAQLIEFTTSNARCKDGVNTSTVAMTEFLARQYATCVEQLWKTHIIKVMTPDFMANTTGMLTTGNFMDPNITRNILVMGVDLGHLTMEVLMELGSNLTDVSAGWLLPSWSLDRIHMAQVVSSIDLNPPLPRTPMRLSPPLPPPSPKPPQSPPSPLPPTPLPPSASSGPPTPPSNASRRGRNPPSSYLMFPPLPPGSSSGTEHQNGWRSDYWLAQDVKAMLHNVHPYFQILATAGTMSLQYVPLTGSTYMLYYRTDLLQQQGWGVPATWDEVLAMARQLNGTDMNGDGMPDWGFCMEVASDCRYADVISSILVPMTQYNTSAQGALFDASNMMPLFNTTALKAALQMFKELASLSPPLMDNGLPLQDYLQSVFQVLWLNESSPLVNLVAHSMLLEVDTRDVNCPFWGSLYFQAGRCAFTMSSGQLWKVAQVVPPNSSHWEGNLDDLRNGGNTQQWYAKGRMGMSMLPGSTKVLNRATNKLVPCTATLCPYGLKGKPEAHTGPDGAPQWVNRAPYAPTLGFVGGLSSSTANVWRNIVASMWVTMASSPLQNLLALSSEAPIILPLHNDLLNLSALPIYSVWGFNTNDTIQYLNAVLDTLNHPNIVPSPAIPNLNYVRAMLSVAGMNVSRDGDPAVAAGELQRRIMVQVLMHKDPMNKGKPDPLWDRQAEFVLSALGAVLTDSPSFRDMLLNTYRFAIGYWGYNISNTTTTPWRKSPSNALPAISMVVPIATTALALLLAALYELRRHMEHRNLFGKVVAPGPYKETTLLVTDIESSTTLWELLSPNIMDKTLHEHHACIRQLLLKHNGYESATEGDSFLLAFHCPEDALLFAMECQVALLECAWPPELLETELCAPTYVVQVETAAKRFVPLDFSAVDSDPSLQHPHDRKASALLDPEQDADLLTSFSATDALAEENGSGLLGHDKQRNRDAMTGPDARDNKPDGAACTTATDRTGNMVMIGVLPTPPGVACTTGAKQGPYNIVLTQDSNVARTRPPGQARGEHTAQPISEASSGTALRGQAGDQPETALPDSVIRVDEASDSIRACSSGLATTTHEVAGSSGDVPVRAPAGTDASGGARRPANLTITLDCGPSSELQREPSHLVQHKSNQHTLRPLLISLFGLGGGGGGNLSAAGTGPAGAGGSVLAQRPSLPAAGGAVGSGRLGPLLGSSGGAAGDAAADGLALLTSGRQRLRPSQPRASQNIGVGDVLMPATPRLLTSPSLEPSLRRGAQEVDEAESGQDKLQDTLQSMASGNMTEPRTFLSEVQAAWQPATASTPNAVLIFRGLRVRMGMATGVSGEADVTYNKAAARTHYTGEILVMAKAVGDTAAGGMVLLSEGAYALLPMESLWDKALVMHIGEYVLSDSLPKLDLYQVAGRRLLGRIAHLTVSRCKAVISQGVLTAPLGLVTVAHAQAVGAMTLLQWNEPATQEALDIFMFKAMESMATLTGGYVADVRVDQVHVVFPQAAEAILWGLNLHKALLEAEWPPELGEHELCEELMVNDVVVFRGMRVKVGLDCGEVVGEVSPLTGRCRYRGRPVTRSYRVMHTATSNQVLCTSTAWSAAQYALQGVALSGASLLAEHHVVAERLGPFKLKGVSEKVELLQCRFASKQLVNKRRASILLSGPHSPSAPISPGQN